ncbi:MAG: hypothetical protein ACK55Z_03125, partial [bacterium]
MSGRDLSPDLNRGMTLAILNCWGTKADVNEQLKMCRKGATIKFLNFLIKNIDMPLKSSDFFGKSIKIASRISESVTGQFANFKSGKVLS